MENKKNQIYEEYNNTINDISYYTGISEKNINRYLQNNELFKTQTTLK